MAINGLNNKTIVNTQTKTTNQTDLANNSGQGPNSVVLDIISKKFNWGAFLLNWIWGLGNRSYLTLLVFPIAIIGLIPVLGIIVPLALNIWFGIKGNTWAWQNKQWKSIEHFHEVQRKWAIAGVIVYVLSTIIALALSIPILLSISTMNAGSH